MRSPVKWALFLSVFALTAATSINFCATLFGCGCQGFLGAVADHCNIHNRVGPHCPWCTHGGAGFVVGMVPVFITQGWIVWRNNAWTLQIRALAALAAYPLLGGALGFLVGWLQGYWNR